MELLGILILLFFGGFILNIVIKAAGVAGKTVKAVAKTAVSEGSFKDTLEEEFASDEYFGKLILRLQNKHKDGLDITQVMMKGNLPNVTLTAYWGLKIYDITEFEQDSQKPIQPVVSAFNMFREPNSTIYHFESTPFQISPYKTYPNLIPLAAFYPEMLTAPYSGKRKLRIVLFMGDANNPVKFTSGFMGQNPPVYLLKSIDTEIIFKEKGYLEAINDADESTTLGIKLAVAVAMADGNLDEQEGFTIKNFIKDNIAFYDPDTQNILKKMFNEAFKEAFNEAKNSKLSVNKMISRLNEIGTKKLKYDAIELCYNVMSADGVADKSEIEILNRIAKDLNLNKNIIDKIKDKSLLKLDSSKSSTTSDIESILSIKKNWSKEKINQHLKNEFKKWNSRYQNLSEGKERENAQNMLNCIAEARKKYAE